MTRSAKLTAALACMAACAGPKAAHRRALASFYGAGDYAAAAEHVRSAHADYGAANEVLYRLDLGLALIDADRAEAADPELARAQDLMEQLWTLSVSKRAGAALANENVDDYRGETFERALAHTFRALAFARHGQTDSALVEARRVETFLDAQTRAAHRPRSYRDDAFARWLAARLYEDAEKEDDARISDAAAARVYGEWEKIYPGRPPEPPVGAGSAELTVIVLEGPAPHKERVAGGGPLGVLLQTSYPAYVLTPARTARVEIATSDLAMSAEVALDVSSIMAKDLEERLLALKMRTTARAAGKLALTALGVDARESEFADIRHWSNLPARIRTGRLLIPAGPMRATVRCLDASNRAIRSILLEAAPPAGKRAWCIVRCP